MSIESPTACVSAWLHRLYSSTVQRSSRRYAINTGRAHLQPHCDTARHLCKDPEEARHVSERSNTRRCEARAVAFSLVARSQSLACLTPEENVFLQDRQDLKGRGCMYGLFEVQNVPVPSRLHRGTTGSALLSRRPGVCKPFHHRMFLC